MGIQAEALDIALQEYEKGVREDEPNWSPDIKEYVENLDPPLDFPIPWCAAFVQFCTDRAAEQEGVPNPLDNVKREAYVQDYYSWAQDYYKLVAEGAELLPGDLVVYSFGGERYDHIGFFERSLDDKTVLTVEGNTSPIGSPDHEPADLQREGDGLYRKTRRKDRHETRFIRWSS